MFRRSDTTNDKPTRPLSRDYSSSTPNSGRSEADISRALEQFDHQQRAQLEQFKRQQSAERQREISRQNQMSTRPAEDTTSNPTPPKQNQPAPVQEGPTHIIAQPRPTTVLPSKNQVTPLSNPSPASPAAPPPSPTKNVAPSASPQAASQKSPDDSTVQVGNLTPSPSVPPLSPTRPTAPQPSPAPQNVPQNSTTSQSLAQPSGVGSPQQNERHEMSTGQKVLLAAGVLSSIFVLAYFVRWWLKRRHHQLNSPRKVDKLNIKGPFKKSEATLTDTDSEPIFGDPGHASISFDRLQVLSEKAATSSSDIYNQSNIPYPSPQSPSATASSLKVEPPQSQPNHLPNLNLISPLSQFNEKTPSDYRCKGPQMKGKVFIVERTYQAALADELVLHIGDRIEVVFYYDDGWCLGQNLDIDRYEQGQLSKGVFPRDCVGAQPVASSAAKERGLTSHQPTYDNVEEQNHKAFRAISSNPSLSPLSSSIFEKFPLPPRSNTRLEAQQRVSSLFIGRNAQLFLELDDALGDPQPSPHIHYEKNSTQPK